MRDYSDEIDDVESTGQRGLTRIKSVVSTAIGAIVAMAMLMALGIWFYRLGVRDAQNVPIIRAADEPAKVRPEDPGGTEAPHQEIASYEAARSEPAQASAVMVAPDPPAPRPEDVPLAALEPRPPAPEVSPVVLAPEVVSATPALRPVTEAAAPEAPPTKETKETKETELAVLVPDNAALPTPSAEEELPPPVAPEVKTGTDLAPKLSPIARRRPDDLIQRTARAADDDARAADDLVRAAARSQVQIQLAADPDEQVMRMMWKQIQKANEDILRGRALAIQSTVSGGKTFYRLRVGPFESGSEARNVCQALKARGQDCIVARNS